MASYDDNITTEYVKIYVIKREKKNIFKPISYFFYLDFSEKKTKKKKKKKEKKTKKNEIFTDSLENWEEGNICLK